MHCKSGILILEIKPKSEWLSVIGDNAFKMQRGGGGGGGPISTWKLSEELGS